MRVFGMVSGLVALAAMGGFAIAGGNGRGAPGPQGGGHPGMGHNHGGHGHGQGHGHGRGHVCPGHGGRGGAGGQGGTGGGAPPPTPCVGSAPPSALITDFSDAVAGNPILFGTAPAITGGTFSYAAPGLTAPVLSLAPGTNGTPALQVAASPGVPTDAGNGFFGLGLFFDSCVDASAYNAVRFTISGTLGGCTIRFAVTSSENVSPADDPRGACTEASCFPPSTPIAVAGTTVVPFFDFTFPGSPNIVDPTSLIGIQWQMDTPPGVACNANFSIDDITFVNAPPASRLSSTFDKDTQGWVLSDFQDAAFTNLNLALTVPPGGTPTTFGFTAADGDPSPGALAVGVTFTDFNQYVDPVLNVFPPVDLSGRTLHARVRLASGSFPVGGLQLHATTLPTFAFAGNFVNADALASGAWVPVELDLGAVTVPGFDATQVVQVGVQFFGGAPDGGAFPGPASAVFEIDTVTD